VLAKALFDKQLVSGHMIRHLYKHLLGWPVTFEDLEMVDDSLYNSLKRIMLHSDDVEDMCLNFTTTENLMGAMQEVSLVKAGETIDVTQDNLPEYIECRLKYAMLGRVKPQLTELLLGFFDVMEEPLLTVFDFQELELLMCGLPVINVSDWLENTDYTGEFTALGGKHQVCKWFWEVVEEYDQEYRARLLQFVTGTSGVPSLGFAVLQGSDGNNRNFTIHGMVRGSTHFPCAHTCFNRIDLPVYPSKSILKEKLTIALEMAATGFDVE
jgi:E3 ubiquitin-protein ligase NEDD4